MFSSRSSFLIFIFLGINSGVFAQPQNNPLAGKDTFLLENERIFDIKDSDKPSIPYPIRELPPQDVSEIQFLSKDYNFESVVSVPKVEMIPYQPAPDSSGDRLMSNYVKLGVGQYLTP
jgi:hypothetical protein